MGIAGLNEGIITPEKTINCSGSFEFGGRSWKCHGAHGATNLQKAIHVSCNVFFNRLAPQLGIINFEKYVLAYIVKLREIVAWLLSLPAKLARLLADCLERLKKLIASVFTDIISSATAVGSGGDAGTGNFSELIAEAKDAAAATGEVLNSVAEAAQLGATIPLAATAGLLVAATPEEIAAANETILNYECCYSSILKFPGQLSQTVFKKF